MDFLKVNKKDFNCRVNVNDIIDFVGEYIKNDNLGIIVNVYVVYVDMKSIFMDVCKQLVKMYFDVVDFFKIG